MRPTTGAHEQYRTRLHRLAEADTLNAIGESWVSVHRASLSTPCHRIYGRFRPGEDPWVVLALQAGECVVRGDVHEEACPGTVPVDGVGHARAYPAEDDPGLPGVRAVLSALSEPRVVRYRPGKRFTAAGSTVDGSRFVKVLADPMPLHRDAIELWQSSRRGELAFEVAQPHGADARTGAFWQGVVAGVPVLDELSGAGGSALTLSMGRALGSLARSKTGFSTVAGHGVHLARSERAAQRVRQRIPDLAPQLDAVLDALRARHAELPSRPLVPVHGAPHAHQWLLDGERLGLVDFDRAALGEPELDVATYLAELDHELLTYPVETLGEQFTQGYRDGGIDLDSDRLALYLTHKRLAKVSRTACSLRPEGDARAARHLRKVSAALGV